MLSSLVIAVALQAEPVKADVAPAVPPERVAQFAEAITKAMPSGRRIECHITARNWNRWTKDAFDPTKAEPFVTRTCTFRAWGPGRTIVAMPEDGYAHVEANGFHYSVSTREREARVDRGSSDPNVFGLALALQIDQFKDLGDRPIGDVIRASVPIALESNGSTLTYRFLTNFEADRLKQAREKDPNVQVPMHEITIDTGDSPRVLGWSLISPGPQGPQVDRWTVDAWQALEGKPFPKTIRREVPIAPTRRPNSKAPEGDVQTQIVEVTDLAPIAADAPAPRPVAEGTHVVDRKLAFEFTAGSTDIVLNGKPLRLREKLWEHPGDKLDELVKEALPR